VGIIEDAAIFNGSVISNADLPTDSASAITCHCATNRDLSHALRSCPSKAIAARNQPRWAESETDRESPEFSLILPGSAPDPTRL
jgi:hypothetical protein